MPAGAVWMVLKEQKNSRESSRGAMQGARASKGRAVRWANGRVVTLPPLAPPASCWFEFNVFGCVDVDVDYESKEVSARALYI